MRLFCRVFLIVLLVVVTAHAADSIQPLVTEHTFTVQLPDTDQTPTGRALRELTTHKALPRKIPSDQIELRHQCLTMRTMHFTRAGADEVQYQKTTTCTPATQFQVKRAVVPLAPTP
jgi:hypothetical protein